MCVQVPGWLAGHLGPGCCCLPPKASHSPAQAVGGGDHPVLHLLAAPAQLSADSTPQGAPVATFHTTCSGTKALQAPGKGRGMADVPIDEPQHCQLSPGHAELIPTSNPTDLGKGTCFSGLISLFANRRIRATVTAWQLSGDSVAWRVWHRAWQAELERELLFQEPWEHTSQPRTENTVSPGAPGRHQCPPARQCTGRRGHSPELGGACHPAPLLQNPKCSQS